MKQPIFLHNVRCSKSREALDLVSKSGKAFELREYLKGPLDLEQLQELQEKLGLKAIDFTRTGESEFKESGLTKDSTDLEILKAIEKFPKLLERPILIVGDKAVIGRPPEKILELLK